MCIYITHAQGAPQLNITWKANNFYPINFEGRALPSPETPVTVSVEETIDGKFVDLSNAEIIWFKDGNRFAYGTGLKESSFDTGEASLGSHFIRVEVTISGRTEAKTIRIPITKPIAVLEVSAINHQVKAGSTIQLTSVPYFFNATSINDFIFSWATGELKQKTGNVNTLSLKVGDPYSDDQRTFTVYSYIQNRLKIMEIVKLATDLYIQ